MLVEIYTRDGCTVCENAKKMLRENHVEFVEHIIDRNITREEVLAKFPGTRALPVITLEGRQIKDVDHFKMLLG